MKLATWNVNSLRVRLPQLKDWLAANPVDVIALQETKIPDCGFPARRDRRRSGLHAVFNGQRTYNGVAILARSVPERRGAPASRHSRTTRDASSRPRSTACGSSTSTCRTGRRSTPPKYPYKLGWLESLRKYLVAELERHPQLVVLGDFNIAPEDRDVHDPVAWEGSVHVSPPERAALRALLDDRTGRLLPPASSSPRRRTRGGTTG